MTTTNVFTNQTSTVTLQYGDVEKVYSGGVASATVNSGGTQYIYAGGVNEDDFSNGGGGERIFSGGVDEGDDISYGIAIVNSGGIFEGGVIGDRLVVSGGAIVQGVRSAEVPFPYHPAPRWKTLLSSTAARPSIPA